MSHAYLAIMGGFALYDENEDFLGVLWDSDNDSRDRKIFSGSPEIMSKVREAVGVQTIHDQNTDESTDTDEDDSWGLGCCVVAICCAPVLCLMGIVAAFQGLKELINPAPKPRQTGQSCLLEILVQKGYIDINEAEVTALGEADILAKILALIQVMWFVLQCISRRAEGLAFAEIEVITLAHAVILGVSYSFWWHKPLRVRNVVRVSWVRRSFEYEQQHPKKASLFRRVFREGPPALRKYLQQDLDDKYGKGCTRRTWCLLPRFLIANFKELLLSTSRPGSIFNPGFGYPPIRHIACVYFAGLVFGAVHFLAWRGGFPTELDEEIWHRATIAMICIPLAIAPFHYLSDQGSRDGKKSWKTKFANAFIILMCVLYAGARLGTIYVAFGTLGNLPYSALRSVKWADFIPHFG
ncbi:hypothetical protein VNI00_018954 [Paramarasmius palmivorus]|uniref:Uncharacterized protein n=1 Tax=Paramarasmius palmivorus TaxID=297713 RepID=A0AAW0AS20_9AGAR